MSSSGPKIDLPSLPLARPSSSEESYDEPRLYTFDEKRNSWKSSSVFSLDIKGALDEVDEADQALKALKDEGPNAVIGFRGRAYNEALLNQIKRDSSFRINTVFKDSKASPGTKIDNLIQKIQSASWDDLKNEVSADDIPVLAYAMEHSYPGAIRAFETICERAPELISIDYIHALDLLIERGSPKEAREAFHALPSFCYRLYKKHDHDPKPLPQGIVEYSANLVLKYFERYPLKDKETAFLNEKDYYRMSDLKRIFNEDLDRLRSLTSSYLSSGSRGTNEKVANAMIGLAAEYHRKYVFPDGYAEYQVDYYPRVLGKILKSPLTSVENRQNAIAAFDDILENPPEHYTILYNFALAIADNCISYPPSLQDPVVTRLISRSNHSNPQVRKLAILVLTQVFSPSDPAINRILLEGCADWDVRDFAIRGFDRAQDKQLSEALKKIDSLDLSKESQVILEGVSKLMTYLLEYRKLSETDFQLALDVLIEVTKYAPAQALKISLERVSITDSKPFKEKVIPQIVSLAYSGLADTRYDFETRKSVLASLKHISTEQSIPHLKFVNPMHLSFSANPFVVLAQELLKPPLTKDNVSLLAELLSVNNSGRGSLGEELEGQRSAIARAIIERFENANPSEKDLMKDLNGLANQVLYAPAPSSEASDLSCSEPSSTF